MPSLIYYGRVIATGDIAPTEDGFICNGSLFHRNVVGDAYSIEEEPPYAGDWLYADGVFRQIVPVPEPVEPAPAVPQSITPRQARLALLQAGLLETVQGAFAQLPEPDKTAASIEWEYATTIERGSPLVAQFGPILGLTDEQLDELFIAAAKL